MKKLLYLLILIPLCFALSSDAKMNFYQAASVGGGAAASCPADDSPDITVDGASGYSFATNNTTDTYLGTKYTGITKQVCKIGFELYEYSGDLTVAPETYVVKIWTASGTTLSTVVSNGTSTSVDADAGFNEPGKWVYFAFAGNPTIESGNYITIENSDGIDATNVTRAYYASAASASLENICLWRGDTLAIVTNHASYEPSIKIFYYD